MSNVPYVNYESYETPSWYKCRECGASEVKLFRRAFSRQAPLLCFACSKEAAELFDSTYGSYGEAEADAMDWIGGRCPAIPLYTDDEVMVGVYAFTGPQRAWWRRLPLRRSVT